MKDDKETPEFGEYVTVMKIIIWTESSCHHGKKFHEYTFSRRGAAK
jgi:hypothetical protein